ncbi:hypothetical protein DSECCO2_347440 [anaerobic digester metagenome]
MGNEYNRLAFPRQVAQDDLEFVNFLWRQHCRGFIQNQDVGFSVKRFQNLDLLLLADRDVLDQCIGIQIEAILVGQLLHIFPGFVQINLKTVHRFIAQNDVLSHREDIDQHEMLMDHADAQLDRLGRIGDLLLLAIDKNLAFFLLIESVQDIHQRRLSSAIFSQKNMDLSFVQIKIHFVIGYDTRKNFGDSLHFNYFFHYRTPWNIIPFQLVLNLIIT